MSFLVELVVQGIAEGVAEWIRKRFGLVGCLVPVGAIALVLALTLWRA